nr:MAG TPA: hypothetical protein [Bacteriophage sp.]
MLCFCVLFILSNKRASYFLNYANVVILKSLTKNLLLTYVKYLDFIVTNSEELIYLLDYQHW